MKKRTRKTIFYLSLLVFTAMTPFLVYYSMGYRIDWQNGKITYVGAISVITKPKGAQVLLDGKLQEEKSPLSLSSAIFIKDLTPKNYKITVAKDGYWTWEKDLAVKPREVTKAELIVLFEKDPQTATILENVSEFWQSGGSKLAFIEFSKDKAKNLIVTDLNNTGAGSVAKIDVSYIESPEVASWDKNESRLIIFDRNNDKYFIADLSQNNIKQLPMRFFLGAEPIKLSGPQFGNPDQDDIVFENNERLYHYILRTGKIEKVAEDIVSWIQNENNIFYIKKDGVLYQSNWELTQSNTISSAPLPSFESQKDYNIIVTRRPLTGDQNIAVLEADGEKRLFLLGRDSKTFDLIENNVEKADFTWDLKKLLIVRENVPVILYLEEITSQPHHDKGEKERIADIKKGEHINWLPQDDNYLIVSEKDAIRIIELDGRDKRNIVNFAKASDLKNIFFNGNEKAVYYLDGQTIKKALINF